MSLYPTILCAIDFSDHSKRALRLALALAARQGSRVVAVHAVDPLLAEAAATLRRHGPLEKEAGAELEGLIDGERSSVSGAPAVEPVVRVGPPAAEVLTVGHEKKAALIAMGTQGLGGIRKLFFGSIAEKVLRDAKVPVVAVPAPEDALAAGAPAIREVLAAVEMDDTSDAVADHALAFATAFDVPLVLLHVVAPVQGAPRAADAAQAAERLRENAARPRLAELASRLSQAMGGGDVEVEVRCGAAAEEIAAAAAERQALVTLASGGHSAHHRPGSIAYRVLCLSDLPVLAIPVRGGSETER